MSADQCERPPATRLAPPLDTKTLRVLFVKRSLRWPRQSGHDVHTFGMMRALGELGHEVALLTVEPLADGALEGFNPMWFGHVQGMPASGARIGYRGLQERFRSYWDTDPSLIEALRDRTRRLRADAVVAAGMDVLPLLPALRGECVRVWHVADDLVRQYLLWVRPWQPATWTYLRQVPIMLAYERAFARDVDRVWAVSPAEARALRRLGGFRTVDVLPNGVDATHFAPIEVDERPESAVFWGRLDFEPNVQAVTWFVRKVWPEVRRARPSATLSLIGFRPGAEVRALHGRDGIEVIADAPDIRPEVCARAVVVLPFRAGGGIKNKLLEAAALARPIVCTPEATEGLDPESRPSLLIVRTAQDWLTALGRLWDDATSRRAIGSALRQWVLTHHSWQGVARRATELLLSSSCRRPA